MHVDPSKLAASSPGRWSVLLAAGLAAMDCGGQVEHSRTAPPDAGLEGTNVGGSPSAGGGAGGNGGRLLLISVGGGGSVVAAGGSAGVVTCSCGYWTGAACDQGRLFANIHALGVGTVGGWCAEDPTGTMGTIHGTLVFDGDGRVKEVDALAGYRWPCLAGQTLLYSCENGYE